MLNSGKMAFHHSSGTGLDFDRNVPQHGYFQDLKSNTKCSDAVEEPHHQDLALIPWLRDHTP
jgi:hypothetical protein